MIITLFSNTSWSLYNFRKDLIIKLLKKNHKIIIISNRDETTKKLIKLGCKFIPIDFNTLSKNPFSEMISLTKIFYIILKSDSDIYINFTIKPCIYFGLLNYFFKKKTISVFDGLGRSFIKNNFFYSFMITLLRISQKYTNKIILVNKDDKNFFFTNRIVKNKNKVFLLKAPGFNVKDFKFKKRFIKKKKIFTFSFISRVIEEKGIIYFLEAAEIIKKKFRSNFNVIGHIQENSILKNIKKYSDARIISYYKNQVNVKKFILSSDCIVLPSYYREGLPRILQEANLYGRICITTNNIGCKDIIINNYNGFICKTKSSKDLAKKIEKVILINRKKLRSMETNAHYFVKQNFNKDNINNEFTNLINYVSKI